jgi:excisionase family DNA binding protein
MTESPWLTTEEACEHLRLTGKCRLRSLYRFLKFHGIPKGRVGHCLRIARADLDRAVRGRDQIRKAS